MVDLQPGEIVAKLYRIERRLAAGGFGQTFLAENITLKDKKAVVKVISDGDRDSGREEALKLVSLRNRNVVEVLAFDEERAAIVLEQVGGQTILELLDEGSLSLSASVRIAKEIAIALTGVHASELVHRDVKPANVMVELRGADGRMAVKLIDFGIALRAGKELTKPPMGSPEFCPFEQHAQYERPHPADDVYALGGVLFLMATGRLVYEPPEIAEEEKKKLLVARGLDPQLLATDREYAQGLVHAIQLSEMHRDAPIPSLVPLVPNERRGPVEDRHVEQLDGLVRQMLHKRREIRPTARQVELALEELDVKMAGASTQVKLNISGLARKTATLVLPQRKEAAAATTLKALPESLVETRGLPVEPRKPPFVMAAIIAVLVGAVAVFAFNALTTKPPTPPVVVPPVVVPVVTAPPVEPPKPLPVVEPPPVVVVDAGAEPIDVPLAAIPKVKPPKPVVKPVEPEAPCEFTTAFRDYARGAVQQLRLLSSNNPKFEKLDEAYAKAMDEKDCPGVKRALSNMRRLAGTE